MQDQRARVRALDHHHNHTSSWILTPWFHPLTHSEALTHTHTHFPPVSKHPLNLTVASCSRAPTQDSIIPSVPIPPPFPHPHFLLLPHLLLFLHPLLRHLLLLFPPACSCAGTSCGHLVRLWKLPQIAAPSPHRQVAPAADGLLQGAHLNSAEELGWSQGSVCAFLVSRCAAASLMTLNLITLKWVCSASNCSTAVKLKVSFTNQVGQQKLEFHDYLLTRV